MLDCCIVTDRSAGLVVYRRRTVSDGSIGSIEVLLGHMGGPLWRNKSNAWGISKGQPNEKEEPINAFAVAVREWQEETSTTPPPTESDTYADLGYIKQSSKTVAAWCFEDKSSGSIDPSNLRSNTFGSDFYY